MTIGSFVLLTIFPALLPPANGAADSNPADSESENNNGDSSNNDNVNNKKSSPKSAEYEYYACLGLDCSNRDKITITDIRKAYRKKSLQLHPDKIAQRKQQSDEGSLKKQYEQVQEAYDCLQDPSNRRVYHDYGCSVARYRFVTGPHPGLYDPVQPIENLSKASVGDKTRIIGAVAAVMLSMLVQPILIAMKVEDNPSLVDASWILILLPWLIFHGLAIVFLAVICIFFRRFDVLLLFTTLEWIAWYACIIVTALAWDENDAVGDKTSTSNWKSISIAFYVAIFCRILKTIINIRTLRGIQGQMVSVTYLEKKEGNGTPLEDLPEEKQVELSEKYVVVHVDEEACEAVRQAYKEQHRASNSTPEDEEEIEEAIKVQTSPEYIAVQKQIRRLYRSISVYVLYWILIVVLVSFKLTPTSKLYNASWWAVFTPIWIAVGIPCVISCYVFACYNSSRDDDDDDDDEDDSDRAQTKKTKDTPEKTEKKETQKTNDDEKDTTTPIAGDEFNFERKLVVDDEFGLNATYGSHDVENPQSSSYLAMGGVSSSTIMFEDASNEDDVKTTQESNGLKDELIQSPSNSDVKETTNSNTQQKKHRSSFLNVTEDLDDDDQDDDQDDDELAGEMLRIRSTACLACCWSVFQIIMLCLVVGKLEAEDVGSTNHEDDDDGYSAFWVLFPIFFITGIVLCCCTCLIFSVDGKEFEQLKQQQQQQHGEPTEARTSNSNDVVVDSLTSDLMVDTGVNGTVFRTESNVSLTAPVIPETKDSSFHQNQNELTVPTDLHKTVVNNNNTVSNHTSVVMDDID